MDPHFITVGPGTLTPVADNHTCAGMSYQSTNYGSTATLHVGTSTTSDHSTTYVTMIKFAIPSEVRDGASVRDRVGVRVKGQG